MRFRALLLLGFFAASGCAPIFPRPFTAAQLMEANSGAALAHYLSQPDASPEVCDARAQGPHVTLGDPSNMKPLVQGLQRGLDEPGLWRRCVLNLLRGLQPETAAGLLDQMGYAYRKLMRRGDLEQDPAVKARLQALHQAFLER